MEFIMLITFDIKINNIKLNKSKKSFNQAFTSTTLANSKLNLSSNLTKDKSLKVFKNMKELSIFYMK
jgi:hypothetical protein